jgi:hypothetical protein
MMTMTMMTMTMMLVMMFIMIMMMGWGRSSPRRPGEGRTASRRHSCAHS